MVYPGKNLQLLVTGTLDKAMFAWPDGEEIPPVDIDNACGQEPEAVYPAKDLHIAW